jgi:hypothetical protein
MVRIRLLQRRVSGELRFGTVSIHGAFGLNPRSKVLDLTGRVRCRGSGARGRAVVSVRWARQSG